MEDSINAGTVRAEAPGPACSVIVIFDRDEPEPCLSSLLAQQDVDFEIIAVTNPGSGIEAGGKLRTISIEDRNPARRRNLAAARAEGGILAFIDDDAEAPEDWLRSACEIFSKMPELAGIGGSNVAPEDQSLAEKISDLILCTPLIGSGNPTYMSSGAPGPAKPGDLHLSNFFVRREAFEKIGGFNEALGYGAEDSEFMYIGGKKLGMKFRFYPGLAVTHRRRPFGIPYLKQRFEFRRRNGRLMLVHPSMYLGNRSLQAGLAAIPAAVIFLAVWPWLWKWMALGYYLAAVLFSTTSKSPAGNDLKPMLPVLPFFYLLHHAAYFSGLAAGIIEGLLIGPGKLRRKLKR